VKVTSALVSTCILVIAGDVIVGPSGIGSSSLHETNDVTIAATANMDKILFMI
jgi:hypothetical protein